VWSSRPALYFSSVPSRTVDGVDRLVDDGPRGRLEANPWCSTPRHVVSAYEERDQELAGQTPALTPHHVPMMRAVLADPTDGDRA
jgi:hypothetical protein